MQPWGRQASRGHATPPPHKPVASLQFPEALRQHLLAILHRASLLVQLREISRQWKDQGLAKPSGELETAGRAVL